MSSKIDLTTFAAFAIFMANNWSSTGTGNVNIFTSGLTEVYDTTEDVDANGVFTAPIDGVYHFDFFMRTTSAQNVIVGFTHSVIGDLNIQQQASGSNTGRVNANVDIEMLEGETMKSLVVTTVASTFIGGRGLNQFNGHFVRPLPDGYIRP